MLTVANVCTHPLIDSLKMSGVSCRLSTIQALVNSLTNRIYQATIIQAAFQNIPQHNDISPPHTSRLQNIKCFQTKRLCTLTRLTTARQNGIPKKNFKIILELQVRRLLKLKQANSLMPMSFTKWIITEEVKRLVTTKHMFLRGQQCF